MIKHLTIVAALVTLATPAWAETITGMTANECRRAAAELRNCVWDDSMHCRRLIYACVKTFDGQGGRTKSTNPKPAVDCSGPILKTPRACDKIFQE